METRQDISKRAEKAISKAKTALILDHVFFGHAIMAFEYIENNDQPTMGTDGTRCLYNADFVLSLSEADLQAVLAHEGAHAMLGHPARMTTLTGLVAGKSVNATPEQHTKWQRANIAADMVVDPLLGTGGIRVPPHGNIPNDPKNAEKSFEQIYHELPPDPPGKKGQCYVPWGDVLPLTGKDGGAPTPAEIAEALQNANVLLTQAAQIAKSAGRLPAGIDRLVNKALTPKVNWKDALLQFVDRAARDDYAWSRPSRRWMPQGLIMPSMHSDALPKIAVAVDTSGSIGGAILDQFASEISAILGTYRTEAVVIYVDAAVASVEEIGTDDLPLTFHPAGGGGTDFKPPFAWLEQHSVTPACLIYLTDMYCDSFPAPPEYPVLWVSTSPNAKAPFGDVIEIGCDD